MGGFALTVASTSNRVSYSGNGSTTAFAFAYPYRASSDLIVNVRTTATGSESLKVEGSDYTVSGTPTSDAGGFASGTVTFGTAPASGTQVHIDRVPTATQTADLIAGDGLQPNSWEGAIDKLTLITQELDARFARTLLQPRTAANRNLILPEPSATTVDQYLKVNAAGTGFELSGSAPSNFTVSVIDYGATGNGTTEDHVAIQAAIDAVSALGGGSIYFPSGTYLIGSTITLKSKVILSGEHYATTTIKAKNSLNADMLKTLNYASLTGQNKYLISEGLQYGFGLSNLTIDGNASNQSSGNGIVCYGKKYFLENLVIYNVKGIGWVSEGWQTVNTATFPDEPESIYRNVDVQNCGSHGIQYRGPSDSYWSAVFTHQNTGWGARFETDNSTYNGACDVIHLHAYANTAGGVYNSCKMRFGHVATESNFGEGLVEAGFGSSYSYIESYINCRTTGTYAMTFSGSATEVGRIWNSDGAEAVSGALVTGSFCRINSGTFNGDASTGVGLTLAGQQNHVEALVYGYSGAGGRGVVFGSGGVGLSNSTVDLETYNCATGYTVTTQGVRSTGTIGVHALATQALAGTDFDGNTSIDVRSLDASSVSVTQKLLAAGVVGSPSLAFSGDRNTGMYSTGADAIGFATGGALRLGISSTGVISAATGEIQAGGDQGGAASKTTLTNTSDVTANSTGVGSIKFKGATSRDTAGFVKIYIGTTAYYVPVFTAITG